MRARHDLNEYKYPEKPASDSHIAVGSMPLLTVLRFSRQCRDIYNATFSGLKWAQGIGAAMTGNLTRPQGAQWNAFGDTRLPTGSQ